MIHRPAAQLDRLLERREGPVVLTGLRARVTERIVCKGEGRLQRQDPFELLDGAIDIVTEIVDVADLRLQLEIERVQSLGLFQLDRRPVMLPLEKREPPRIPKMGRGRARAELEGARERLAPRRVDPSRGSSRSGRELYARRQASGRAPDAFSTAYRACGTVSRAGLMPRPE